MFSPYHHCANTTILQEQISRLGELGSIPDTLLQDYKRYHFALVHKLKSSRTHLDNLQRLLSDTPPQDIVGPSNDFHFTINLLVDSFFYSMGSSMDILAREVLTYYGIPATGDIYFQSAHTLISSSRPGDPILRLLVVPSWRREFANYRNILTHELLIVGRYSLDISVDGGIQRQKIIIPLPDNPRDDINSRTYNRNRDVFVYCCSTLRRLLSIVNQVHGEVARNIRTNHRLPL